VPLFPFLSQTNPVHVIASIFFPLLRSFLKNPSQMSCLTPRTVYMFLRCTPLPSPQAGGPPLVGCPRRSSLLLWTSGGCVLRPKPWDAPLLVQWNSTDVLITNGTWCATKTWKCFFSYVSEISACIRFRPAVFSWLKKISIKCLIYFCRKIAWSNTVVTAKIVPGYYEIGLCGTSCIASYTSYKLISNSIIFIG